jgi:phosphoglycolate phosphatase
MRTRINEYISKRDPDMSLEAPTTMELVARFVQRNDNEIEDDLRKLHLIMDETEIESSIHAKHLVDIAVVLGTLGDMGFKLGLLTRSCERYSELVLGEYMSLFDAISCRTPGRPAKPDPSALLEIAGSLGVEVEHLILIGDHWIDGQCAINAGAQFLAVTTGSSSAEDLSRYSPIAVLDDLRSLPEFLGELTTM